MCDAIRHRGPDAEGIWTDQPRGIALGHRRLSIIDLSPTGAQPMRSRDGRWTLTFNGEIYNFRELRRELAGAGVEFRGTSDTEVLVEGIARWGIRPTVERVAGMFAFGLWDSRDGVLTLSRDRLGEKPLYYGWRDGQFAFASELKALREPGALGRPSLDHLAVARLLRYSCIPAPLTVFSSVAKLPPATMATVRPDGTVTVEPYWSLVTAAEQGRARSLPTETLDGAADRLEAQLRETVAEQMISDVPLGALLSGGVDSSLVVALMAKASAQRVRTFTIGFREPGYNEAEFASDVARHIGTNHTELYVAPETARAVIPRLAGIYDEPFADASQIPTFLVAELARTQVTVALSGDGGDETFGGYVRYFSGERLWRRIEHIPRPLRTLGAGVVRAVPPRGWDAFAPLARRVLGGEWQAGRVGDRAHKAATLLGARSRGELYDRFCSHWAEIPSLVLDVPSAERTVSRFADGTSPFSFVEEMMLADAAGYLPDDVLVKVDRAAMAVSLETRAPLLDHRVIELAWSIALGHKVAAGEGKRVLKQVLFRHVPRALVDRPKMGFGVPLDTWLRGPLREWGEDLLSEERLRRQGLLRVEPIRAAWREHLSGRENLQYPLWNVLMLQSWLDA